MMPPNPPAWKITYQQPMTGLGPDGRAVEGMKVGFETAKGVNSWVFIPRERYNLDTVKAAVADEARKVDSIHALLG
jgi:hypothetical protein